MFDMSKLQKPYFTSDEVTIILDSLINSVRTTDIKEKSDIKSLESLFVAAQKYIQSPKHQYENALLRGVVEGRFTFGYKNGSATFRVYKSPVIESFVMSYDKMQETSTDPLAIKKLHEESADKGLAKLMADMKTNEASLVNLVAALKHSNAKNVGDIKRFIVEPCGASASSSGSHTCP